MPVNYFKFMLFSSIAISLSSCNTLSLIKSDSKARYIASAKLTESTINSLINARKLGFIKDDDKWQNIKIASDTATKAFKAWNDSIIKGKSSIEMEDLAMIALEVLKKYNIEYKNEG